MQQGSMLIDHGCRLRAAIAIHAIEIEGRDAVFAEGAFECGTAIQRLGCVISHTLHCSPSTVLLPVRALGNGCATLEHETLSLAESSDWSKRDVPRPSVIIGKFHSECFATLRVKKAHPSPQLTIA
jgi:hypothetical protein